MKGSTVWATLSHLLWLGILLAGGAVLLTAFWPLVQEIDRLERQKEKLQHEAAVEQSRSRDLNLQLELLQSDPTYVTRIARDRLSLGKKGEIIFRFDPYPLPSDREATSDK
ncbi:septum formation initiator family protein [Verrucomicrobium sp. 3C]|uniref:FtsB family cell division protein n=1 Tax=Verrucomicrobium sp. 3C TaxID=1134055 RepID=UPI000379669D|nr:septum formation initiator family protein [Verrucomicrobium sp. 3C]